MLLLLAGSTDTARQMIADEFLGEHADWRHLALEDIYDPEEAEEDDFGFQQTFMTMVACECARDAMKEGHHVIITVPISEMIEAVFQEFPQPPKTIYLGAEDEADGFDHIINTSDKSMADVCNFLKKVIKGSAE